MKIIYFGSDTFGIPSLERLKRKHSLMCVVTAPDRPSGRGMKISATPVKTWALENRIPVHQPENIADANFIETLNNLSPDLIILISYGKILSKAIINLPSLKAINVHPSLLPKYRGAAPIEWALINGEQETGITVITIKNKVDTGDIIKQKKVIVNENDDIRSLKQRLSKLAPSLLIESIKDVEKGIQPLPQQGTPTYARRLQKKDGLIKWSQSAIEIYNLVRGLKEWPGTYTFLNGKYIKIYGAYPAQEDSNQTPGEVVNLDKSYLYVACGKGILKINKIQMEGKKLMSISEFLRGHPIEKGSTFSERS